MAELAETTVHGNLTVTGAIISEQATQLFKDLQEFVTYMKGLNSSNVEEDDTTLDSITSLGLVRYFGNTHDDSALIQTPSACLINVGDVITLRADKGIVLEGDITLRKKGQTNTSEYTISNLVAGKATALTTTKNLTFSDGYLTYSLSNILNTANQGTKGTQNLANVGNAPYLPISGISENMYLMQLGSNNQSSGLFIKNSSTGRIQINNYKIQANTDVVNHYFNNKSFFKFTASSSTLLIDSTVNKLEIKAAAQNVIIGGSSLKASLDKKVDTSRTINGHPLTKNITLKLEELFFTGTNPYKTTGIPGVTYKDKNNKAQSLCLTDAQWNTLCSKMKCGHLRNILVAIYFGAHANTWSKPITFKYQKNVKSKAEKWVAAKVNDKATTRPPKTDLV